MQISELIMYLSNIKKDHGDLVVCRDTAFGRKPCYKPEIAYTKILNTRERKHEFYYDYQTIDKKGEKVVKL